MCFTTPPTTPRWSCAWCSRNWASPTGPRSSTAPRKRSAAYRRLNPSATIPALETPQGPLFETGAILLWLSETHAALAPQPGAPERGDFLKWLFFTANTLHAQMRMAFYPHRYAPGAEAVMTGALTRHLAGHFRLLDTLAGAGHDWFAGPAPSVLDFYVAVLMRWARLYAAGGGWCAPGDTPALSALAGRLETRASVRAVAEAEGLGARVFTDPGPCRPPEGSVI